MNTATYPPPVFPPAIDNAPLVYPRSRYRGPRGPGVDAAGRSRGVLLLARLIARISRLSEWERQFVLGLDARTGGNSRKIRTKKELSKLEEIWKSVK